MKALDLIGQQFGFLTVIERDYERESTLKKKESYWKCKCKCGKIISARGTGLKRGDYQSCGCMSNELRTQATKKAYENKAKELIGKRFNQLVVLELDKDYKIKNNIQNRNDTFYYKCKCDCGNIKTISKRQLGKTISCGCYQQKRAAELGKKDITGEKFGLLTVLKMTDKRSTNHGIICECKCDCGKIIEIPSTSLRSGHTTSCGCIKSKGENVIEQILIKNNIQFEREKTFETCIYPETKFKLRFDFYVNNNFLLEFDGIQHFQTNGSWCDEEKVKQTQLRDTYKNNWAKENNIPLKRIPYFDSNNLTIEDIMGNKYLVT